MCSAQPCGLLVFLFLSFFYLYVLHHVSEALKKKNLFLFATIILAPLLVY